jgi:hypothetical protein
MEETNSLEKPSIVVSESQDNVVLAAIRSEDVRNAVAKYFRSQYDLKVDPVTIRSKLTTVLVDE